MRHENIAGEIDRLEAALEGERDALRRASGGQERRLLRLNLAIGHEELGVLYRRLHALDGDDQAAVTLLRWVIDSTARAYR